MDILIGILIFFAGLAICFAGLRVFFILLPVLGFLVGFFAGAALVSAVFGDGFLSTALGIIVGVAVGFLFALISYFWWYLAVIISAGAAGASLTASLLVTLGMDAEWLLWLLAIAVSFLFMIAAFVIAYPIIVVIVISALNGAGFILLGVLLVFNSVDREELGTGVLWDQLDDNWFLWLIWLALSVFGIVSQVRMTARMVLPEDKWDRAPFPGTSAPAAT